MSYAVGWDRNAWAIVEALDPFFAAALLDGAERLAAAPTRLSRPKGHPHYSGRQRYGFTVDDRDVTLFFVYAPDERSIHIVDV